jgi:hypothetical protein
MKENIFRPIIDLINGLSTRQAELSNEVIKIRYQNLELLEILKSTSVLNQDEIIRIFNKGEDYENSKIETRN